MIEYLLPPKEIPPKAREHCRYYSHSRGFNGGPQCAAGRDMSAPGAALPCMPTEYQRGATCAKRKEWTEGERAAWKAFQDKSLVRVGVIMQAIPREGLGGRFECPVCGGQVSWSRARNGHIHAACSTRFCFSVMQ